MYVIRNDLENKKAQHPVGLFRIGCLSIANIEF